MPNSYQVVTNIQTSDSAEVILNNSMVVYQGDASPSILHTYEIVNPQCVATLTEILNALWKEKKESSKYEKIF